MRLVTYLVVRTMLRAYLGGFFRWKMIGMKHIPRSGPAIIAANHISYFDPLCHAYAVDRAGRWPRFFAKAELWNSPLLRPILSNCRQIPVVRGTGEAGPVEKAIEQLQDGQIVVIYPEATITTNADLTPMPGKTGIARVALATGAPVIPVAVWGSHWVRPKGRKAVRKFRRLITLKAGEPLTFAGNSEDASRLHEIADEVIGELDRLVRELHKVYPEGSRVPELRASS